MIPNERASGGSNTGGASTVTSGHTTPATLPVRPHQPVASAPSAYGQHQPTPPFKSAQSRF
jgi:hypothetical protein